VSDYTENDELLDEALRCDPVAGGYDRRDEPPCELCGQPTAQIIVTRYGGPRPLCAACWDPVVHGAPPVANATLGRRTAGQRQAVAEGEGL
jgi:hypothetical protein